MMHQPARGSENYDLDPCDISSPIQVLRQRACTNRDEIAFTFLVGDELAETHWTFEELDFRARAIAAELVERGAVGKRALLMYDPGLEFVAALAGCLYAGTVAVPLYPPDPMRMHRTLPRLNAIFADADADFVLTSDRALGAARVEFEARVSGFFGHRSM